MKALLEFLLKIDISMKSYFLKTKDQLLEKIRAFEPPGKCKDINLLVIGSIGSGKSSLVNTFTTVLRDNDQIATPAVANENHFASVTSNVSVNF